MRSFWEKLFRIILYSRFEPVETVLSLIVFLTSVWVIFPHWDFSSTASATGLPVIQELVLGVFMAASSVLHITGMARGWESHNSKMRQFGLMGLFMSYAAITALYIYAAGIISIGWIAYVGLALLTAISYLSVSMGIRLDE